jgi:hypothetical protein
MNLLRVPALQTALLFGHSIDTNADVSMLIVDDWTVIEFKNMNRYLTKGSVGSDGLISRVAGTVLAKAVDLRKFILILCRCFSLKE